MANRRQSIWSILAIAFLAMVGSLPGRTQGLGLLTESLLRGLYIDRVTYATINLWVTIIGEAFCLPCGRLIDRFGSRTVLTSVLFSLGATAVAMSWLTGTTGTCIAITLTRGFGRSAWSVVSLALVGKWFARRLNQAMGVYSCLGRGQIHRRVPSVGQGVLRFGWRGTWVGIGWVLILILMPLAWFLVHDRPEDLGLTWDYPGLRADDDCACLGHRSPVAS